jgi:hypothetical protein
MRVATLVLLLVTATVGCAPRQKDPSRPSVVTVTNYNATAESGRRIEYDGRTVYVVAVNPASSAEKVVWSRSLRPAERAGLDEQIHRVQLAEFEDEYVHPFHRTGRFEGNGMKLFFGIRLPGEATRSISIHDVWVEELGVLCETLDMLLPSKFRFSYGSWMDAMDDLDERIRKWEESGRPRDPTDVGNQ